MLKNKLLLAKVTLFAVVLPFIYGCQGGGGGGSTSGFIGGGSGSSLAGGGSIGGGGGFGGGGEEIINPEPASMLLFGSGMMAMALWKRKTAK